MPVVANTLATFSLKKPFVGFYEKGYQMIEVLVALLILMIGVTSIGGIQIFSLKNNRQSAHHICALSLLQDISNSMHANPTATDNEQYATLFSQGVLTGKKCINTRTTCTSKELAQAELETWKKNINSAFFEGEGEIIFSRLNSQLHAHITIRWNDSGENLKDNEKKCIKEGGKLSCQNLFINFCNPHSPIKSCQN